MACEFVCDGCGKRAPGEAGADHNWHKPRAWYERSTTDDAGYAMKIFTACSRECCESVNTKSGDGVPIMPF